MDEEEDGDGLDGGADLGLPCRQQKNQKPEVRKPDRENTIISSSIASLSCWRRHKGWRFEKVEDVETECSEGKSPYTFCIGYNVIVISESLH